MECVGNLKSSALRLPRGFTLAAGQNLVWLALRLARGAAKVFS
jgi:hypothetical protein